MGFFGGGGGSSVAQGGSGGLGGTSTSSQTQDFQFNPVFNFGSDNANEIGSSSSNSTDIAPTTENTQTQDATASNQDEFGLSAGVAVGAGSSAMGGSVGTGGSGDIQPIGAGVQSGLYPAKDNTLIYLGAGGIGLFVLYAYMNKKKSS